MVFNFWSALLNALGLGEGWLLIETINDRKDITSNGGFWGNEG